MPYLRRGFLKSAHRPNYLYSRIDPLPFLGFILVLLCAFMTAEPMITKGAGIDLPTCPHSVPMPRATEWDAIHIAATRDGSVYFRNRKAVLDDLPNLIHDAVLNGSEKKIYFSVDARARYGDVKVVFPEIRLAGLEKVCFLTW